MPAWVQSGEQGWEARSSASFWECSWKCSTPAMPAYTGTTGYTTLEAKTLKWMKLGEQRRNRGKKKQRKKFHLLSCWLLPPSFIITKHQVYMRLVKQINEAKRRTYWGARRIFKIQQEMRFGLPFVLVWLLNSITPSTPNLYQKASVHSFKTWCH